MKALALGINLDTTVFFEQRFVTKYTFPIEKQVVNLCLQQASEYKMP